VSTGYETPSLLAIRPDGQGDVTDTHVAWTLRRGAPNTPSPLAVDDLLFIVSDGGVASCLNPLTGEAYWQQRLGGNYSASPVHAEGRVYFQSEDGVGTVIEASRQFRTLAVNDLQERTLASCAVDDGALYIRSDKHLYRIGQPSP
jgi:outer membrane protein assembly factor BamB